MQISLHEVEEQVLRVGIRRGDKARPPLLLFNGIGANIELVELFSTRSMDRKRSSSTCPASAAHRRPGCRTVLRRWHG
jgi:hypothetical protein